MTPSRRWVAEALGTAFLLAMVVGSGIMAERLAAGNAALALLANSIATGAGLMALIFTFAPISGAHFNPAVTLLMAFEGQLSWQAVPGYVVAQTLGAFVGVASAHLMFAEPIFVLSQHVRSGYAQFCSEFIATFGLMAVILSCARYRPHHIAIAVGAYITAAYWFTSSTAFANPAVTLARALTNTFSGIRLADVGCFIVAQLAGTLSAWFLLRWLLDRPKNLS
jgi:hypothetical protein